MFRKIKLFFSGLVFIFLGIFAISLKFLVGEEIPLPLWPFDGIAAILGGAFIAAWSLKVIAEPEGESGEPRDRNLDGSEAP